MQEMDSLIKGRAYLLQQQLCVMQTEKAQEMVKNYWKVHGSLKGITVLTALASYTQADHECYEKMRQLKEALKASQVNIINLNENEGNVDN